MQQGGRLGLEQSLVVVGWYARTNLSEVAIPVGHPYRGAMPAPDVGLVRAWNAWAHATTVEFSIGTRPCLTAPLIELLGPRVYGSSCGNPVNDHEPLLRQRAEKMFGRFRDAIDTDDARTLSDLPDDVRNGWLAVAALPPLGQHIIPERQNFCVNISTDRQALSALLNVMPENVAPRPLVWVHLEGVLRRSIA